MRETMSATKAVHDAVRYVEFGPAASFENLSVVPILDAHERDGEYLTLDEALAAGCVTITEVSDAGQVSALQAVVTGDRPVLLLDGEELTGAKQNRVVNLTILLRPRRTTVVPVSCVESGRWHHQSREFSSALHAQFAEGRAARLRQVTASMMQTGNHSSDQDAVWDLIADKAGRLDARSETSAMSAMFDDLATPLEEFVAAFPPLAHQVGAVFYINGEPAGLERFDAASSWRKLAPKLLRSYALDAIDRRGRAARPLDAAASRAFATLVEATPTSVFPSIGEGEDVRLTGADTVGAALVAGDRVVHLSAFPASAQERSTRRPWR